MLLRITVSLLCVAFVLCAERPKIEKGERKKRTSKEDFAAMFKQNPEEGSDEKTMRLGTSRVDEAFDDDTDMLRNDFSDVMTDNETERLRQMRNMRCPDGTKVFNLTGVVLKEAIKAAEELSPLMTSNSSSSTESPVNSNMSQNMRTSTQGLGFKPIACWNGTKTELQQVLGNFSEEQIKKVFHPKLVALISDRLAERMSPLLPDQANRLLCDELKEADTKDMMAVAKRFPCKDRLKQMAKKDSTLAEALLQEERERGLGQLSDSDWDTMLDDFGTATPRDFLISAPSQKIKERFAELWDEEKADLLVDKVDFTTVDADFVKSLGDKVCQLPTSALLKIPKTDLEADMSSLSCLKKEKNKSKKRRLANKLLGTRDAAKCKEFLQEVDPTDKKCWKLLSSSDLQDFNFTAIGSEDMEEISCETAKELKTNLQLGNVSEWDEEQVLEHKWLLRCMGPDDMDDDDVDHLAEIMAGGGMQEDADLPPSVKRKVMKKMKQNLLNGGSSMDETKLTKMRGVLGAMTSGDVEEFSADLVNTALLTLQKEFSQMDPPAKRRLVKKLSLDQLKEHLCDLDEMAEDVPADMLAQMTDLGTTLVDTENCKFKCRNHEQCAAVYAHFTETLEGWNEASRDFLARARDTGAMCGMPLEDVTQLQPATNFLDVAAAFFKSECDNPAMTQLFSDKLRLFMEFTAQRDIGSAEVEQLGGNYFKHMDTEDLNAYGTEEKSEILHALGQTDLDDVDTQWVKDMAAAAVSASVAANADIDEAAVLSLGSLVCGVDASHVSRMTSSALSDALPDLSDCPDVSVEVQRTARQAMVDKLSLDYSTMEAADLSLGGTVLLSDCQNMDKIPDDAKQEAMGDLADAASQWKQNRQQRNERWRDPSSGEQQRQDQMKGDMRCGLTKMLEATARVRTQSSQGGRRKRAVGTVTCDDIRLLGEEAVILSEMDIAALSDADFNNCADVLGSVTEWSQSQKNALASKAKQAWGEVTTWPGSDVLLTAGAIAQGLTAQELSTMGLTLQHLEEMGQHKGWTSEQLAAAFNGWLSSDSNVNGNVASITSNHLQQLGHFVCGATPTQISGISTSAYSGAMSEIGDAEHCSSDQLQAWAARAIAALGPVTSWSLAQTAAVDRVLAGLRSADLSLLSSSQLSVMDLDTFAAIPPQEFASLTVLQLQSLSTQHAMSITQDQLSVLNEPQKGALQDLGVSFVRDNSADGLRITMGTLVAMAIASLTMIRG